MKALIIGGAGFIGSHIADKLRQEGFEVVVVDNLSTGDRNWLREDVTFYEMDMFDAELETVFVTEQPDYVFHQAAQVSVTQSMTFPMEDARMNILGTINVLECSIRHRVKRFIFASSAAVYGTPDHLPIKESHPLTPISFYGMSKAFAEEYIKLFCTLNNIEYSIFRYANVYGPRQSIYGEAGVIALFFNKFINGEPVTIFGDGTQTRDFIYVDDIASACVKSLSLIESSIINLGTSTSVSINDLVKNLTDVTNKKIETQIMPSKDGDISHSYLDNQSAINKLDWEPNFTVYKGLNDMYQQYLPSEN